jgi:hypothetical protein
MSRLTHSHEAFLRMMQMSEFEVFVFVEGERDQFFYGLICDRAYGDRVRYRFHRANELPIGVGKQALTGFFRFLAHVKKLCHTFKSQKKVAVFCLDKDIDELTGDVILSPHIVQGELHSLENYLVVYGDVPMAMASAVERDIATVRVTFRRNDSGWRRAAAAQWSAWMVLCVCARLNRVDPSPTNYSSPSLIQTGAYGTVDVARHEHYRSLLRGALGASDDDFDALHESAEAIVVERIDNDRVDEVFKGKWYGYFFIEDARRLYGKSLDLKTLFNALQVTLDVSAGWADAFVGHLRRVAACDAAA